MMDDRIKALNTLELAHIAGEVDLDTIMKARGHKYLRKVPDGKGGWTYIYDEPESEFNVGDIIAEQEKGLDIKRYSDKSIIITGNTYANVDLLRKIKNDLGVGVWNASLKGWIFPMSYIDKVLSYVITKTEDDEKREALENQKNGSLENGESVDVAGVNGKVVANVSDTEGVKYDVTLPDGGKLEGVDESVMGSSPNSDDEAAKTINEVQPETRSKAIKEVYGIKPIENAHTYTIEEYLGLHGINKAENTLFGHWDSEDKKKIKAQAISKHREAIEKAVEEGKEIKEEVLNDYPEVKAQYDKKRQAMSEETKRKISEALKKHKPEDVKTEKTKEEQFKEFIDSIPKETLENLATSFKQAYSEEVEKQQGKLAEMVAEQESMTKKKFDLYAQARATNSYDIKLPLEEEARGLGRKLEGLTKKINNQKNVVKAVQNGGDLISFTDKTGTKHENIADFTRVDTSDITYDIKSILTDEVPKYIPTIDEDVFRRKGYILDAIRIDKDTYMVATNGHSEEGERVIQERAIVDYTGFDSEKSGYVVLTLDQLVLTNDYYTTKQRAVFQKVADEKNKRAEDHWDSLTPARKEYYYNQAGFYNSVPAAVKKKYSREQWNALSMEEKEKLYKPIKHYGPERLKSVIEDGKLWASFHDMYERFVDISATKRTREGNPVKLGHRGMGLIANIKVSLEWHKFSEMLNWKLKDIKVQREVESDVRKAALETSFGESNTNDSLKEKSGILVKRQNGEKINPQEVEEISKAWNEIQGTFGSLVGNAKKDNLKISHTGNKHIFASKAAGMYVPKMGTIAVSAKFGSDQFGFTMGHEVAHWIDHSIGKTKGKRFASDDYESTAGQVAIAFRRGLNEKTLSDYTNSTSECFARALEQYHAIETKGEGAEMAKQGRYFASNDYVNKEHYESKVKPLVKQFLDENRHLLKSIGIDINNKAMDQIQKALNTLELAHMMGQVDNDTIEKARNKSGLYSDTTYNRKQGRANQPYNKRSDMEGHFKGETSTGKKFDVRHEAEHENHKEFTSEEHKEVAEKHRKMVGSVHSEEQKDYHRKQAEEHERMGKEKSKNDILNDYDKKEADKHFVQLANRFKNEPLSLVEHFAVKMKEDYFKDHSGSTSHDTSSAKFDRNRIAGMEEYLKNRKEEESNKEDKKEPYDGKKALKEFNDRNDAVMQKITPEQRKQARKEWEDAGAKEDWHDFLDKYAEKHDKKDLSTKVKENEERKKKISIEEHRKNETAFRESLKKEKTSEGINKRFKEISNDQKYIDMPMNRQNYIADYADELESKLKDDFSSAVKSAMFPKTYTDKPKEKQPYHKNDGLDVFRDIAMKVKDAKEFIDKTREIKGVPDKIANKFAEKYGKGGMLSMEKTSQNFIDEVKGSK